MIGYIFAIGGLLLVAIGLLYLYEHIITSLRTAVGA